MDELVLRVNDRMLNLDKEIIIRSDDRVLFNGHISRTIATLYKTLAERGDPESVFSGEIIVSFKEKQ